MIVLDTSALQAFLFKEPGRERVAKDLRGGTMSMVNLAEALTKLRQEAFSRERAMAVVARLGINWAEFSVVQADLAADLSPATKPFGLSLGARACLALAIHLQARVLTADRTWARLDLPVAIEVIR